VDRKSIAQLMQVDSRTAIFGPLGLMTDRRLTDESAVDYIQAVVEGLDLPGSVPETVREHFDTLRHLHVYGAFSYDLFSLSAESAHTALELVLGVRFIDWYGGQVPLREHRTGRSEVVPADDFARLRLRLGRRRRSDGSGGWHLEGDPDFDGSLASLLRWARAKGVLSRWLGKMWSRARRLVLEREINQLGPDRRIPVEWEAWTREEKASWIETTLRPLWEEDYLDIIRELRNLIVHRTSGFITSPVESARSLERLAEIIMSMWPPAEDARAGKLMPDSERSGT
jgi:hypothetical protein